MKNIIIHLRVWSNNKYDIDTLCGKFGRTTTKPEIRGWRYTYLEEEITCKECKNIIEKRPKHTQKH